jgi:hypothetical protein
MVIDYWEDRRMKKRGLALIIVLLVAVGQARANVVDTLSGWNGTDRIIYFGEPDTATYGQTITVGSDNVLNSFTFLLNDSAISNPVNFQGYVMAWNDSTSRATGSVLYSSSPVSTTGASGYETFTFNTGNLALTPGSQYVLFVNCSNNFDSLFDEAAMASRGSSDVYAGGLFVFLNNGSNFGDVTSSAWTRNWQGPGYDTAFVASLSEGGVIPEPSTIAVWSLLGGLGIIGWWRRRR